MKKFIILLLFSVFSIFVNGAVRHITVVISLDGFRWDYPQLFDTPFLDSMETKGVSSGLIPSFPSKTFPNHYTIATGLYPDHHGIVGNSFYDRTTDVTFSLSSTEQKNNPSFYGGEPIWITAQKQGLKTAIFYWPGSDVKVKGQYPNTFFFYDKKPMLTFEQRINGIINQLNKNKEDQPDLIMTYFEEPDASGHLTGPQSKRTRQAVQKIDSLLHGLYDSILHLPIANQVNFIVLSDHGMTWVSKEHSIDITKMLKPTWIKMMEGNVPTNIYAEQGCVDSIFNILRKVDHIKVWKKTDIPAYLHYGTNSRVGDIVATPDLGYVINTELHGGNHGYDPTLQDMHALFRAIGPDFKNHCAFPDFENVNIYRLLCRLLHITPSTNDGDEEMIDKMLK